MADQKPPRLVTDERATVLALLQYQRDSLVRKVSGAVPLNLVTRRRGGRRRAEPR